MPTIAPLLEIRPAAAGDVPAIAAIYAHHVRHGLGSFELEPPAEAEMERRRLEIAARGLPYLAALEGEELVGYAYAGPYRPRPAYRYTVENSVYVKPGREHRGVGRRLLAALLAECEALGLRQVVAVIGDSANDASIRLHESLGFRRAGLLHAVGFKFGRWVDSVQMQRELGPGDRAPPV